MTLSKNDAPKIGTGCFKRLITFMYTYTHAFHFVNRKNVFRRKIIKKI